MIDIAKILKRAWNILWNYRTLWIFGFLLALTGGGGGNGLNYQFSRRRGNGGYNPDSGFNFNPPNDSVRQFNLWFEQHVASLFTHPEQYVTTLIWIGVGLLLFILIASLIAAFIRYTSEAAILRMVDEHEQSGVKAGFKQGWKLGWSRRAFRMWVIDLVTSLPAILLVLLLLGMGLLVFFSVRGGNTGLAVGGAIASIGCVFLLLFALVVLAVFLNLLRQFFVRKAALEDASIGDSFRQGWQMFTRNWKSAALVWLVMLGINIGFGIATLILFILLIPVFLITGLAGLIVAAIPGLAAFGIASLFASSPLTWIIAGIVALPFFFLVTFSPLCLIGGLYDIFQSSVWTLTFRELKTLETLAPASMPSDQSSV
jgi:hypothetical protein